MPVTFSTMFSRFPSRNTYLSIILLFHYNIIIIIVVEGCQQRAEGSKRQCCKTNYTKCITTEPLWSRYSNPHCKYKIDNTDYDGESSNLDKHGDGSDGVDGLGDDDGDNRYSDDGDNSYSGEGDNG